MITAPPTLLETSLPLAAAYTVTLYAVLLLAASAWLRWPPVARAATPATGRYGTLDGLRGALAGGVFIHHSLAAYGYFMDGRWQWSSSALMNHLGQTTVALFFMITGFLFSTKAMAPTLDWRGLYRSRAWRLLPLYGVVVLIVALAAFALTGWQLQESTAAVALELLQWLCFGRPDINRLPMTWTLIAGVNWSLKYEVAFYVVAVPAVHLLARRRPPELLLATALVLLAATLLLRRLLGEGPGVTLWAAHFLGGIVAACLYRIDRARAWFSRRAPRTASALAIGGLLAYRDSFSATAVLLTTLFFVAVVHGASCFGLLRSRAALWLGDISYGTYLLHGLLLWATLHALQAAGLLPLLELPQYTVIMLAVAVGVTAVSSLSFVMLERPLHTWGGRRRG